MTLLLLLACDDPSGGEEASFEVTSVVPEDGATDATEAQQPELLFNAAIDGRSCNEETIRLDGVLADGSVAFPIEIYVEEGEDSRRALLRHTGGLPRGWSYAITVAGGESGCTDLDHREIVPFLSTFVVP